MDIGMHPGSAIAFACSGGNSEPGNDYQGLV